jgi:RNA polymerase sigma-70 factor (ECF subfamily)
LFVRNRERLLGFVRGKVGDDSLAEDILQESLLKALRAAPELRDQDRLLPWFYRILRNGITDAYRRSEASQRSLERFSASEFEASVSPAEEAELCSCFRELLPTLKPEYAEVIEAMDLGETGSREMSERLGVTANNLKVRRHRARRQLRERLETTCGVCAEHGCLDCSCGR